MDPGLLALITLLVVMGALVKGFAGFGFGIMTTALLVNFMPAKEAVTLMLMPLIAVNIPLVIDTELKKLERCLNNYRIFIFAGIFGTFLGFLAVDFLPSNIFSITIGLLSLGYVYLKQNTVPKPFHQKLVSTCFTEKWYNQTLIGTVAGAAFGASNIGLLFVTYLSSLEMDRKTFTGVLSFLLLFTIGLRTGLSLETGLFTQKLFLISLALGAVAFTASALASKLSHLVEDRHLEILALMIILIAGARILYLNLL